MTADQIVQLVDVLAWPCVALFALIVVRKPLAGLVGRISSVKAGKDGIEIVVNALERERPLSPTQRRELLGLSSGDIWALDSFNKGSVTAETVAMNPAQKVAARVLADAGLVHLTDTPSGKRAVVTPLGQELLKAAGNLV